MRIVVVAAGGPTPAFDALRQEGLDPELRLVEGEYGYAQLLTELGTGYVLVEGDVVPWPGACKELWECPEPWCGFEFPQGKGMLHPGLGCVCVQGEARSWSAPWIGLDSEVHSVLGAMHTHFPPVAHAREQT